MYVFDRLENNMGKEENAIFAVFSSPTMFSKGIYSLCYEKIVSFGKDLILSQMTNFSLFQTERVCRRQFQM